MPSVFSNNGVTACVDERGEAVSGIVREKSDGSGYAVEYPNAERVMEVTHHSGRFVAPSSTVVDNWHAWLAGLPNVTRRDYVHDGGVLLEWVTPDEVVLDGGMQRWINVRHFERMRPDVPTCTPADLIDWSEPPEGVDPSKVCYTNELLRFCDKESAVHTYWIVVGDREPRLHQGGVEVTYGGSVGFCA
jgi:hypothetical protein